MDNNHTFGKIERVELREIWEHESLSFTPWLAENLHYLSEAINIDLQLEDMETNVGMFRADILAKNALTGQWVLVENQLERTDHCHLGQLLTYAAGLKASVVVWIASQFTDEHIAALDWLNGIIDSSTQLFGIQIEAWRIGHMIAPKLTVVSKPNTWAKKTVKAASNRFNKTAFVLDCLKENPTMTPAEIKERAAKVNQVISDQIISMARKNVEAYI